MLREDASGWVTIVLPDGQHRVVPYQATSLGKRGKRVIPIPDLPHISVRTILPVVRLLSEKRILRGEGNNGTRNDNAVDGRISAARAATESTSASVAGAENRGQAATGFQLGTTHRARKRSARVGGST
jgi:hypothetical protein